MAGMTEVTGIQRNKGNPLPAVRIKAGGNPVESRHNKVKGASVVLYSFKLIHTNP